MFWCILVKEDILIYFIDEKICFKNDYTNQNKDISSA